MRMHVRDDLEALAQEGVDALGVWGLNAPGVAVGRQDLLNALRELPAPAGIGYALPIQPGGVEPAQRMIRAVDQVLDVQAGTTPLLLGELVASASPSSASVSISGEWAPLRARRLRSEGTSLAIADGCSGAR
jgi:hypothetical protein